MKIAIERRSYIVLVGISIMMSIMVILFCAKLVDGANKRTCQVLEIALSNPVPNPAGISDTQLRETLYKRYLAYGKLYRELKCPH